MDNPGVSVLAAAAVTVPLTAQAFSPIDDLDGIQAANLLCEMTGGTAGTSIDVLAQTSFDDGTTWLDVAHFTFNNTGSKKYVVLNALASKAVTAYSALGAEGVNDGLLGDMMQAVITTVGTYTNTTIALRLHAK
jgi:hypothetical protein